MKQESLIKMLEITDEPRLLSRGMADVVFDYFERPNPIRIELDFFGIDFISRSFADQFHKNKILFYEHKNIEIVVVNCNKSVFDTFQDVAGTNEPSFKRVYKKAQYKVWEIKNKNDIKNLDFAF